MREERDYLTVTEFTERIKELIEDAFYPQVSVRGEISSLDRSKRGHFYFVLKDKNAQLKCVLFLGKYRFFKDVLKEGKEVICTGTVDLYMPRGEYSLVVDYVEEVGWGALYKRFEELKRKLESEGLFDEKFKKSIPVLPKLVGIITSPEGAAIRDIKRIIRDSGCFIRIVIYPSHVQGKEAVREIVEGIRFFNEEFPVDVIVLTRGGGSVEDLWAFNEEEVARAIFASEVPVISAVGHERDWTIADFVADHRCATPTHAARFLVDRHQGLREALDRWRRYLTSYMENRLSHCVKDLEILKRRLELRDPKRCVAEASIRLDELADRMDRYTRAVIKESRRSLERLKGDLLKNHPALKVADFRRGLLTLKDRMLYAFHNRLSEKKGMLNAFSSKLEALSPRAVLSRGYAICYYNGKVLKDPNRVDVGDMVMVELAEGALECRVKRKRPLFRSC